MDFVNQTLHHLAQTMPMFPLYERHETDVYKFQLLARDEFRRCLCAIYALRCEFFAVKLKEPFYMLCFDRFE